MVLVQAAACRFHDTNVFSLLLIVSVSLNLLEHVIEFLGGTSFDAHKATIGALTISEHVPSRNWWEHWNDQASHQVRVMVLDFAILFGGNIVNVWKSAFDARNVCHCVKPAISIRFWIVRALGAKVQLASSSLELHPS